MEEVSEPDSPRKASKLNIEELGLPQTEEKHEQKEPSACEECANKVRSWLSDWGYDIVAALISIADVSTDIIVMRQYYLRGHSTFFWLSLTIVMIAQLCYCLAFTMVFSKFYASWKSQLCLFLSVIPISPLLGFVFMWTSIPNNSLGPFLERYFDLHVNGYDPAQHPDDSTLKKWIMVKLDRHMGFILEAAIEAFPQSLLQMTALVYYGDGQVSGVAIASILLSLLSVSSKSLVFSQALVPSLFAFNWLCLVNDFICVFTVISWVFAPSDDPSLLPSSFWVFGSFSTLGQMYILVFLLCVLPLTFGGTFILLLNITFNTFKDTINPSFTLEECWIDCSIGVCFMICFICGMIPGFLFSLLFGSVPCLSFGALMLHVMNHERFSDSSSDAWLGIFQFLDESYIPNSKLIKWKVLLSALLGGCNDDISELKDLAMRTAVANLFLSSARCTDEPILHQHLHQVFFQKGEIPVIPEIVRSVRRDGNSLYRFDLKIGFDEQRDEQIDGHRILQLNGLSAQDSHQSRDLFKQVSFPMIRCHHQREYASNEGDNGSTNVSTFWRELWHLYCTMERECSDSLRYSKQYRTHDIWIDTLTLFAARICLCFSLPLWILSRIFHWLFPLICLINAISHQSTRAFRGELALQSALSILYLSLQMCIWYLFCSRVAWFHYLTWHVIPHERESLMSLRYAQTFQHKVVQDIRDFYSVVVLRPTQELILFQMLGSDVASVVLDYLPVAFEYHRWLLYTDVQHLEGYERRIKYQDPEEEEED